MSYSTPRPSPTLRTAYEEALFEATRLAAEGQLGAAYEVLGIFLDAFRRRYAEGNLIATPDWQAATETFDPAEPDPPEAGYFVERMGYDRVDSQFALYVWPLEPLLFHVRFMGTSYGSKELLLCRQHEDVGRRHEALRVQLQQPATPDLHHVGLDAGWSLVAADPQTREELKERYPSPPPVVHDRIGLETADLTCLTQLARRDNANAVETMAAMLDDPSLPAAQRGSVWTGLMHSSLGVARLTEKFQATADHPDPRVRQASQRALDSIEALALRIQRRRDDNLAIESLMDAHH